MTFFFLGLGASVAALEESAPGAAASGTGAAFFFLGFGTGASAGTSAFFPAVGVGAAASGAGATYNTYSNNLFTREVSSMRVHVQCALLEALWSLHLPVPLHLISLCLYIFIQRIKSLCTILCSWDINKTWQRPCSSWALARARR